MGWYNNNRQCRGMQHLLRLLLKSNNIFSLLFFFLFFKKEEGKAIGQQR